MDEIRAVLAGRGSRCILFCERGMLPGAASVQPNPMVSCGRCRGPFSCVQNTQSGQHGCTTWGRPMALLAITRRCATAWRRR
eukprot:825221-Amphidinium_carterae.1